VIAEAGVNHNGDIQMAKALIEAARIAGADAVKFQTFNADKLLTRSAEKAQYQKTASEEAESQHSMLKRLELADHDFGELAEYAKSQRIIFLSSPFDMDSVDLIDKIGMPAFKVPSGEITNFPLLQKIAKKRKPVILSTGMSTFREIEEAVKVMRECRCSKIILLHCVSDYPAKVEEVNLRAIEAMRKLYDLPVGYSDHTLGITIPIAAVALGACVIEKHLTLDRKLPGPDHKASIEPNEFENMVSAIREVEAALGDGVKRPTRGETEIMKIARKSIVAAVDISSGSIITDNMITVKRPGTGIEPKYINELIGQTANCNIECDTIITWNMINVNK